MTLATALLGCAQGVSVEPEPRPDAATGLLPIAGGGATRDAASPSDSGADAGTQDTRVPCAMGQTSTCTCPNDGPETTLRCVFDATSSLDGYFDACPACPEPVDAAVSPCADGAKNGSESDTDCGGPDCDPCSDGDSCVSDGDCASGKCEASVCAMGSMSMTDAAVDAGATGPMACNPATSTCDLPFTPSNFDPSGLDFATAGAMTTIDCSAEIDTSGTPSFTTWCSGPQPSIAVQTQSGGGEVVVVAMQALSVTGTLRAVGTRPLVLAVMGDATIAGGGRIDASANGTTSGAGGGQCGAGMGQGADNTSSSNYTGGGGGGGFGTAGGRGGSGDNGSEPSAEGGIAHGTPELSPLLAGCRGGNTSQCSGGGGGGGGGGAVQLTAGGTLTVAGTIDVNGGDGPRNDCGAGGGSGGGILLEGTEVNASAATLSAGGGDASGGSAAGPNGASGSNDPGTPGQDGGNGNPLDGGSGGGGGYGRVHVTAMGGSCTGASCS